MEGEANAMVRSIQERRVYSKRSVVLNIVIILSLLGGIAIGIIVYNHLRDFYILMYILIICLTIEFIRLTIKLKKRK